MANLKYSTHPQIIPEMTKHIAASYSKGWIIKEVEFTFDILTSLIKTEAYIPSKLTDGHKLRDKVEEVYFAALDFDKDITIEQFKARIKELKIKASWFLHTTRSHTFDNHKFRVIIPFNKPMSGDDYRKSGNVWRSLFPELDESSIQGERFFHISPNAITYMSIFTTDGEIIEGDSSKDFENIDESKITFVNSTSLLSINIPKENKIKLDIVGNDDEEIKKQSKEDGVRHKKQYISMYDMIKLSDGRETSIENIEEEHGKVQIFCPLCLSSNRRRSNPQSTNGFIKKNEDGRYFMYCSSSGQKFYQDPTEVEVFYDDLFFAYDQERICEVNGSNLHFITNEDSWAEVCKSHEPKLRLDIKKSLQSRVITFDPSKESGHLEEKMHGRQIYNIFKESDLLLEWKVKNNLNKINVNNSAEFLQKNCPSIYFIFKNIFDKDEYIEYFINWVSYIIKTREKPSTTWLISTNQRAGKDVLFNWILQPIFGKEQATLFNGKHIGDTYNGYMRNIWLCGYNEVFASKSVNGNLARKEWLKDNVTANEITIEEKFINITTMKNNVNYILFSNNKNPILLDKDDGRFNIIRNDNSKNLNLYDGPEWPRNQEDRKSVINKDLNSFVELLFSLEVDKNKVDNPIDNIAKRDQIKASQEEYDDFIDALKDKDVDYFNIESIKDFQQDVSNAMLNSSGLFVEEMIKIHGQIPSAYIEIILMKTLGYKNSKNYHLKQLKALGLTTRSINKPQNMIDIPVENKFKIWEVI